MFHFLLLFGLANALFLGISHSTRLQYLSIQIYPYKKKNIFKWNVCSINVKQCRKWFNGKQSLWFLFDSPLFSLIRSGYFASLDHNTCTIHYTIVQCPNSSYFIVTQSSCFNVTLSSPTLSPYLTHIFEANIECDKSTI